MHLLDSVEFCGFNSFYEWIGSYCWLKRVSALLASSRLPSIAHRHPFVLLRLVYSENEHVHQLALKALAKHSHRWSGNLPLVYMYCSLCWWGTNESLAWRTNAHYILPLLLLASFNWATFPELLQIWRDLPKGLGSNIASAGFFTVPVIVITLCACKAGNEDIVSSSIRLCLSVYVSAK